MAEQPRREEGRSGQRDHGNLRQHHDSPNDCQPCVRRQDCLRAQAHRGHRGHARRDARGEERWIRGLRRQARGNHRRGDLGGRPGNRGHPEAERQEARRRAREPAERAARVPGVRAQDVLAPEPGKGQEGRHAGKDHLRVLLPAHVEGAWGDLHLQTPVPAGVRGRRGRRDGERGPHSGG